MPAMALDQYAIAFKNYPWLPTFNPFQKWGTSSKATKDLPWYAAYNAVKHNHEAHFSQARLEHAFEAALPADGQLVRSGFPGVGARSLPGGQQVMGTGRVIARLG